MTTSPSDLELLTVAQFAQLLKVSRTTVFHLINTGDLEEGVHYIRLGRILRFRWLEELLFRKKTKSRTRTTPKRRPTAPGRPTTSTTATVNLDYGFSLL